MSQRKFLMSVLICTIALMAVSPSLSQDGDNKYPTGESIMQRHIDSTGGAKAYKALTSMMTEGALTVVAGEREIPGKVIQHQDLVKGRMVMDVQIGGQSLQMSGTDGVQAWRVLPQSPMGGGPSLLDGDEGEQLNNQATYDKLLNFKDHYKTIKTVGKEAVDGEDCYKVEFTKENGQLSIDYFSIASGLQRRSVMMADDGKIAKDVKMSNYKKVEGVLQPHSIETTIPSGQLLRVEVEEVVCNKPMAEETFALPPAILKLVEAKKAKEAAAKKAAEEAKKAGGK